MATMLNYGYAVLRASGRLDELSLMKEYANRAQMLHQALREHLTLLFGILAQAPLIGIPPGFIYHRSARWRSSLFAMLNIIQTLTDIVLFGLLIAPLSGLSARIGYWPCADGLGALMFHGLLSSALELVLFGVIPPIALPLLVDTLFEVIISMLQKGAYD